MIKIILLDINKHRRTMNSYKGHLNQVKKLGQIKKI